MHAKDGWGLSEKEKQTLRLIVRGHDAKSIARSLDLSVHTINERLREARRKMAVSSSREAARLLLDAEGGSPDPHSPGDNRIGEDGAAAAADGEMPIAIGPARAIRRSGIFIGVLLMTVFLALLAIAAFPQDGPATSQAPIAATEPMNAQVVDAARRFLVLVDAGRWDESYRLTGAAFRKLNTAKVWADTSEKVRVPLGAVISRTVFSQENLPAPPAGYEVVKFRTVYANRAEAIETVSLDRESGQWHVVGITIG